MVALALGISLGATAPALVGASAPHSVLRVSAGPGYGGYAKVRGSNFASRTTIDVGVFDGTSGLLIGYTTARTSASGNFVAWVAVPCHAAVDVYANHAAGGSSISRHLRAPGCVA